MENLIESPPHRALVGGVLPNNLSVVGGLGFRHHPVAQMCLPGEPTTVKGSWVSTPGALQVTLVFFGSKGLGGHPWVLRLRRDLFGNKRCMFVQDSRKSVNVLISQVSSCVSWIDYQFRFQNVAL